MASIAYDVTNYTNYFCTENLNQSDLSKVRIENKKIFETFQDYLNKANDPTVSSASVDRAYDLLPNALALFVARCGNEPRQYDDLLNQINEGEVAFSRV